MMEKTVHFSTLIRAKPERAYDAIATTEGINGWFTTGATVDPRPGGAYHFRWKDYGLTKYCGENRGTVLEASRPKRFVFRWKADSGGYDTTVEIDFEPVKEGTIVRLKERGYEDSTVGEQDFMNRVYGWAEVLTLMKFYVEHGLKY
jgi:uncharacterized protein YndB with AHSA1/START domain